MKKTIGFIGAGNIARAMVQGFVKAKPQLKQRIYLYDIHEAKLNDFRREFGVQTVSSLEELCENAGFIVLAIKPFVYAQVLGQIRKLITYDQVVISLAPGISLEALRSHLGGSNPVVRLMPNTPALVQEAMIAFCYEEDLRAEDRDELFDLLSTLGRVDIIEEKLMDTVVAVSGSSPAYVYQFIEALADGAVLNGMPRDKAYTYAAQAVLGAAKMILETGEHPGRLKDNVCTPGGTTIEGIFVLEREGLRSTVIQAVNAAVQKSKQLSGVYLVPAVLSRSG